MIELYTIWKVNLITLQYAYNFRIIKVVVVSLFFCNSRIVLSSIYWSTTVAPTENAPPYAATIRLFQVENTIWGLLRPVATLCRKIIKLHFQYSSFCVILHHCEGWYSTYIGISRHLRKKGALSAGATVHVWTNASNWYTDLLDILYALIWYLI